MDATNTIKRKPNLITRNIAGETLLVPLVGKIADLQRVIALNAVGAFIWERLENPQTLDELVSSLVSAFAVDADTARHDVMDFCEKLEAANLTETVA